MDGRGGPHIRALLQLTPSGSWVCVLQGALPLCATQQCDVTGKFQESIGAAKALCVALRLEHAYLLQVHSAQNPRP